MARTPTSRANRRAKTVTLGKRERQFAALLWRRGGLARSEIHQITGVHPTLTGQSVALLIRAGLVRNGKPASSAERGRPQTPVVIDPDRRKFLGISLSPGEVRVVRLDPMGRPLGEEIVRRVGGQSRENGDLVTLAARSLKQAIDPAIFSIGITVTGVVDPAGQALLFSSALPSASPVSLKPIYQAAGDIPVILDNDLHALSMRWLMTSESPEGEVMLVGIDDGRLGASVLIDGRPQRGSVTAGNELGHTRLAVETDRCYCGQVGCLERIVSSRQLKHFGAKTERSLDKVLADPGPDRQALLRLLDLLVTGLGNAVNFMRPARLVIASPLGRHTILQQYIQDELPDRVLPGIRSRVRVSFWEQPYVQSAENAAWLAISDVFGESPAVVEREGAGASR